MQENKTSKTFLTLLIVFLIGGGIYLAVSFFSSNKENGALSSTDNAVLDSSADLGGEVLGAAGLIKATVLDLEFFNDPVFRSLEDFWREPIPERAGKENPFSPVGR